MDRAGKRHASLSIIPIPFGALIQGFFCQEVWCDSRSQGRTLVRAVWWQQATWWKVQICSSTNWTLAIYVAMVLCFWRIRIQKSEITQTLQHTCMMVNGCGLWEGVIVDPCQLDIDFDFPISTNLTWDGFLREMGFYVSFSYGPMVNRVSETFDSDNHPINNTWPPVELYSAKHTQIWVCWHWRDWPW